MERGNHTVTEFIPLGFTADPGMQRVLFVVFLAVYVLTLLRNATLMVLICSDVRLHMPMYFIGNLSFLDLCLSSVYTPKILVTCVSEDKSISFAGCVAQFFFSAGLDYTECYLLATMAYDRYVAISKPLLYAQAVPRKLTLDDFFCDSPPLVKIACGKKRSSQAVLFFLLASNVIAPIGLILASYLFIIATILRTRSTQRRRKAFSTCSSHLISVTLYYGSSLYIYARPRSSYSLDRDKIVSPFYTVVFPMLNPLIYSLRNKDVKEALNKLFK
ncbi:Olfactory receptor 9G9 [Heterocephalus glaber]|uniref:Olfactory receptor 9G9 n=1 Tax=Heterocephalus glaber TaxID=10181 RepID=G5AK64_HETGA|nr:Olfactory receptor 9G9 [Heterocephalus glaber]